MDRYGPAALIQSYDADGADAHVVDALAGALLDGIAGPCLGVVLKERGTRGPAAEGRLLRGVLPPPHPRDRFAERPGRLVIDEDGILFGIDLLYGVSTGLFLDARPLRGLVRARSAGVRVLNLFSYTSGFGVAAATGGARSTTNVDVVPSALERGEANYALNDLPCDARTHARSDVFEVLRRAVRSGTQWDLVIVDPPPVPTDGVRRGTKRARGFDPLRDQEKVIAGALAVCSPHGSVLAMSAARSRAGFEEPLARACAGLESDVAPFRRPIARAADFPGEPGDGLRAVWITAPPRAEGPDRRADEPALDSPP